MLRYRLIATIDSSPKDFQALSTILMERCVKLEVEKLGENAPRAAREVLSPKGSLVKVPAGMENVAYKNENTQASKVWLRVRSINKPFNRTKAAAEIARGSGSTRACSSSVRARAVSTRFRSGGSSIELIGRKVG